MSRPLKNPRVRRQLFRDDDVTDQANVDNLANMLKETSARDRAQQVEKWNFDFENEVPLVGKYEWYPCGATTDWVGVKKDENCKEDRESCLSMKMENEVTPVVKEQTRQATRKRKLNSLAVAKKGIRKKIIFDESQ